MYDVVIYNIDAISESQMSMTMENFRTGRKFEYKRVTADFSSDIIGLWEGVEMTGDGTRFTTTFTWRKVESLAVTAF